MNYLFIVFILIVAVVFYLIQKNKEKDAAIKSEWDMGKIIEQRESIISVKKYCENKREFDGVEGIDEMTWSDIEMDVVFSKINSTKTSIGAEYLFDKMHHLDNHQLAEDEKLYELFRENRSGREEIIKKLMKLGKDDYSDSSIFFFKKYTNIKYIYAYIIMGMMPILLIPILFFDLKIGIFALIASYCVNLGIYYKNKYFLDSNLNATSYVSKVIQTARHLSKIKDPNFKYYKDLFAENTKSLKKISVYNRITSLGKGTGEFEAFFEYIRLVFLLDYISYYNMIKLITKYKENYKEIWLNIGKLDAAIAVELYRKHSDSFCIPHFSAENEVMAENMYHPLIEEPIANTFTLKKRMLLTGANASGKSSFLKALAINTILAQTIHTVHASSWISPRAFVITSMAIKDNILNGDSYFKAEIKSLKRIIEAIEEGEYCLVVIDEILKGTNTVERISASASIMNWLSKKAGLTVIATHDIELTEMLKNQYENYHFSEKVAEDTIQFDFKIKEGPATTRNAIKLLAVFGYPLEVIAEAREIADVLEGKSLNNEIVKQ